MCLFLSFPLFSLLFLSLQAGWKKRLTIKLSKHHLLLTPSSPLIHPSFSVSLSSFPPSIPPLLSAFSHCTRKLFTSALPSSHPRPLKKKNKQKKSARRREDLRQWRRGWGRGGFVNLPCPLCPPVPFFSIQSLYSTGLPVTLLCRYVLLHSTLHMCTQTIITRIKTET